MAAPEEKFPEIVESVNDLLSLADEKGIQMTVVTRWPEAKDADSALGLHHNLDCVKEAVLLLLLAIYATTNRDLDEVSPEEADAPEDGGELH